MAGLFFEQALLPQGWARDVRLLIDRGRIVTVESGTTAHHGDECHRIGLPGLSNLHSHAFQRGMAGLVECRGPTSDSFWTWRELMYKFVGRMTPDDIEAIAAQAYVEMLESGFTRVGEFHYIHHDVSGVPYRNIAELAERIVAAAAKLPASVSRCFRYFMRIPGLAAVSLFRASAGLSTTSISSPA